MIQKEDFDKLKQLDRIEYILRFNKLEEHNPSSLAGGLIRDLVLYLFPFILIVAMLGYLINKIIFIAVIRALLIIINIAIPTIIIFFIIDLILIYKFKKKRESLDKEFFNFKDKIKPKR